VIRYTRQIVFAAVVGFPGGVWAQSPAPPPPPAAAEVPPPSVPPAPEGAVAAPPTSPQIDPARFDEIEQLARISARKHELLEEDAAKKAKEAPKVTADDKGFSMRLPDNSFVLRIRGLVQGDGRFFLDSQANQVNDTFLVRKFRPTLEGTLFSLIDFRLMPELAGTVQILDGYVDLHPWDWLRLRVGKYKAPIGLERLQGDADRVFLEQALVQNLSSQRDVGVQLWGDVAGGIVHYVAGVFNGSPDNVGADVDTSHAKDFQGRLFFHPFRAEGLKDFGNLGIGVAGGTGNRKGRLPTATAAAITGLSPFRTTGQLTFFQYLAPGTDTTGATTVFANGRASRINPQLYYYYQGFGLLAEYLWLSQGVQRGNSTADLKHHSTAATVSYTINGRENFDGTTPDVGLDPEKGTWGALVIAARYSWIKLDDATFGDPNDPSVTQYASPTASARSAQTYGVAATWVPRRTVRYAISYERTRFEGGAGTAMALADRTTENVIIGRAQASF
jgi:phosphate-selective porin OprO and OprP